MAKKTKGKVIQMLSPENYIKQRARSLPILECRINSNWEQTKMAQISIARAHVNGNITVCFYLADLYCLGVTDSTYHFNISPISYQEIADNIEDEMQSILVTYELVHNILFTVTEFADEYGFKPHKDFTRITRFMLEEDSDDIPLIEIECGINGQPTVLKDYFDESVERSTIAQLEKTAGKGNFVLIDQDSDQMTDIWQEGLDEDDDYNSYTLEQKRSLFKEMLDNGDPVQGSDIPAVIDLVHSINIDLCDEELVETYYDEYIGILDFNLDIDFVPAQLLGLNHDADVHPMLAEEFITLYMKIINDEPHQIAGFKKQHPFIPGSYFLELLSLIIAKELPHDEKLTKYKLQYPEYSLIQLLALLQEIIKSDDVKKISGYPFAIQTIFPNRDSIHLIELYQFLQIFPSILLKEHNLNKLIAFIDAADELLPEEIAQDFMPLLMITNIEILIHLLDIQFATTS
ncbi:MAG: hypothetical protein ACERKD_16225 [Prolixibacteraceae bacterium]